MKDLGFSDRTATTTDDDGDDHTHTVRAATVSKETKGRTVTTRAGARQVNEGDVVIESGPGTYDVLSKDEWDTTGYSDKAKAVSSKGDDDSDNDAAPAFSAGRHRQT